MKCRAPSGCRRPSEFQVAVHLDGDLAQGPSTKYTVFMGRAFRSGLLPYPQYMFSSAVAGEVFTQVKTHQVPITNSSPSHYIICHLPLVFLSPTSPLPFYSPSLSILTLFLYLPLFARLLFVCLCVGLLACHDGSR